MRKLLLLLVTLLLPGFLWGAISSKLNIEETDGAPSTFPYKLKVPPGTLTDNNDGTATFAITAASLPSGSTKYVQIGETLQTGATFYVSSGTVGNLNVSTLNVTSINGTFLGLGRNRAINGEMNIDQANGGAAVTINSGSAKYGVDKIKAFGESADGVYTISRSASTPPTGFSSFLRVTVTTADSSVGIAQIYEIQHDLEGYMTRDFLLGSSGAKTFTLSFWVRSSVAGTYSGGFLNGNSNRSQTFTYTINSANMWEFKTITMTGDITGTWDSTTGVGLSLSLDMGSGSNFEAAAGSWNASGKWRTASSARLIGTLNATWDLTGLQIELGSTATAFEYRPFAIDLMLCQRYYEKSYPVDVAAGANDGNTIVVLAQDVGTILQEGFVSWKVTKRANPTVTVYKQDGTSGQMTWIDTAGATAARTTTAANATTAGVYIRQTAAANEFIAEGHWVADARL